MTADDDCRQPRFLPVGLNVHKRRCVIVGGGAVGTRKARTLCKAGADVTIISPDLTPELTEMTRKGNVKNINDTFRDEHLTGAFLVVVATNDERVNERVVNQSRSSVPLVCDATSSARTELIFGAMFDTDEATVAVFTHGRDPKQAANIRDRVAAMLNAGHAHIDHHEP